MQRGTRREYIRMNQPALARRVVYASRLSADPQLAPHRRLRLPLSRLRLRGERSALQRAFAEHDADLPAYRERRFIATLDPEGEENVRVYTAAIENLCT